MPFDQYDIVEASNGAIICSFEGAQVSSFPSGIGASVWQDLIPSRQFVHINECTYITVDNGTEHGLQFPDAGLYVPPHKSGIRLPTPRALLNAFMQARNDSLVWLVPTGGEQITVRFFDADPGALSTGTTQPEVTTAALVTPSGFQVSGTSDSVGPKEALDVAFGYDTNAVDDIFIPARTPNVWTFNTLVSQPYGSNVLTIYTAPNQQYWRLLFLQVVLADLPSAPTNTFWQVQEAGVARTARDGFDVQAGSEVISKTKLYPGSGMKANSENSALQVQVWYLNSGGSGVYTAAFTAGLYVGS